MSQNLSQKIEQTFPDSREDKKLNLLYFHNENIDSKKYYEEKKKNPKTLLEQTKNLKNNITHQPKIINNNPDKSENDSSFDSLDFSDSENEEIKLKREEIIKKMIKRTDDISLIQFDIYDCSKLIDFVIDSDIDIQNLEGKNKKDITFIDEENISTYSSYNHSPKIELIKKSKIKNDKKYEKRINNFKRMEKSQKNEKSISKNKNKERSRTKSIKH